MAIRLLIKTIPHDKQEYETCGNWKANIIYVDDMGKPANEHLVALHEYVEKLYCDFNGISEKAVTKFDKEYDKSRAAKRAPCGCVHEDEPGDDKHAPYYKAHQLATIVEKLVALEIGVNWIEYNQGE